MDQEEDKGGCKKWRLWDFRGMTLCCWVGGFHRYEGTWSVHEGPRGPTRMSGSGYTEKMCR